MVQTIDQSGYRVTGEGKLRTVRCAQCGQDARITIVAHLKRKHPETWQSFVDQFLESRRAGRSLKKIMWDFDRLFSWTVIARALAENGAPLALANAKTKPLQPAEFECEATTMWSFKSRGAWALHDARYRGNWPPQVPRNLISLYSRPGDLVLDPFVGGGTTAIEAILTKRRFLGCDINPQAVTYSNAKLEALHDRQQNIGREVATYKIVQCDAGDLTFVGNESVDLICAHPPYLDIIPYTKDPRDLSVISDVTKFKERLRRISLEFYRVLKDSAFCCIQIGDVRKNGTYIPLGFEALKVLQNAFDLKQIIVKEQPQTAMAYFWKRNQSGSAFLRIAHEYIFVMKKNAGIQAPRAVGPRNGDRTD